MSKICYIRKTFTRSSKRLIAIANEILNEYAAQGFVLTLRQLYYQFVARDILPNRQKSYNRLGAIIGDARLAGLVDWEYLEDRTRNLKTLQHFSGPQDALDKLASWYHVDLWASQDWRPEVWIEKDALAGVIQGVCEENDVPYFSCRGYTSLSEMWSASQRLREYIRTGQQPYIIHFGDHDPSGMDMSRDIYDRLHKTFMADCEFQRVALNMDQIEQYAPPPNPAKVTDSRYKTYVQKFGDESWELDALEPSRFRELVELELSKLRDDQQWNKDVEARETVTAQLLDLAGNWIGHTERLDRAESEVKRLSKEVTRLQKLADKSKRNGRKPKGK